MNKSKGNMYPWVTHTWNPLGGECPHRCSYCSTNKLKRWPGIKSKYSGKPRLYESELQTNLGSGNFIFVCAQSDLFAEAVPSEIIEKILLYCMRFDNKYLFQTKNPKRLLSFQNELKALDFVLCTTIETNRHYTTEMRDCPKPEDRAHWMNEIAHEFGFNYPNEKLYVTIEPIMDFDLHQFDTLIETCLATQVNIGANSDAKRPVPEPSKEKVNALIKCLEKHTTVKVKSNLQRIIGPP
ncbi:DUF5131 family protein [Draconibacterium mangrovi]|uniref:DUF5131 family protein n=1 Tax=Draconibacterium mangrovi TaxID=2697469 RepID=UPI0013D7DBA3|nr:DUF5131 family protein [Draconibacterium mangrovi]